MARGEDDSSTNQVGRRGLTPWESPTASSLVAAMFVEELRFFCQVPANIDPELSDGVVVSIVGWANNSVYFTPGADCYRTSISYFVVDETIPTLYSCTS